MKEKTFIKWPNVLDLATGKRVEWQDCYGKDYRKNMFTEKEQVQELWPFDVQEFL